MPAAEKFRRSYPAQLAAEDACLLLAVDGQEHLGYLLGFQHLTFYVNGPVAWIEEVLVRRQDRGPGQLTSAGVPADDASRLRGDPAALLRLIEHPGVFRAVLGPADAAHGWVVAASPFLVFAAVLQQATTELASMDHVPARRRDALPGRRVPRLRHHPCPRPA